MCIPWQYTVIPLKECFDPTDGDYSIDPSTARFTVYEKLDVSFEEYPFWRPVLTKSVSPLTVSSHVVSHFVWLKQSGLVDSHINGYLYSYSRSGYPIEQYIEQTVELVDSQIKWELLDQSERVKLVKKHFNDFLTINYSLEALQEKVGNALSDPITESVACYIDNQVI